MPMKNFELPNYTEKHVFSFYLATSSQIFRKNSLYMYIKEIWRWGEKYLQKQFKENMSD